jgi:hypothetical protein
MAPPSPANRTAIQNASGPVNAACGGFNVELAAPQGTAAKGQGRFLTTPDRRVTGGDGKSYPALKGAFTLHHLSKINAPAGLLGDRSKMKLTGGRIEPCNRRHGV